MLIHVEFHKDETLSSFLSRTAAANGSGNARSLLSHLGMNMDLVSNKVFTLPAGFYEMLGVVPDRLERARNIRLGKYLHDVGGHQLERRSFLRSGMRYCARCLVQDMGSFRGTPCTRPYARMSWSNTNVLVCPAHQVELAQLEEGLRGSSDFTARISSMWGEICAQSDRSEPSTTHAADEYFSNRLDDSLLTPTFLDSVPYYVAENLGIHLGALRTFGSKARTANFRDRIAELRRSGFEIFAGGETGFRSFLGGIAADYWKTAAWHPAAGLFGSLYRYLDRHHDQAHGAVKQIVQDVAVDRLPLGPGDNFLGNPSRRRWHTVATAARQYGRTTSDVRKILAEKGYLSEGHRPANDFLFAMDSEVIQAVLNGEPGLLTLNQLVRKLGMSDLIHTCVFDPTWRYALKPHFNADRGTARYCPNEAQDLLRLMTQKSNSSARPDMVSLFDGARLAFCSMEELLTHLVEGRLSRVSHERSGKFSGIKVSYSELREVRSPPYPGHLHYEDVALRLQVPISLARDLMKREIIPATWTTLPTVSKTYRVMLPSQFERFHSQHVSVYALAKSLGRAKKTVVNNLADAGVTPSVSAHDGEPVFYLRQDVST